MSPPSRGTASSPAEGSRGQTRCEDITVAEFRDDLKSVYKQFNRRWVRALASIKSDEKGSTSLVLMDLDTDYNLRVSVPLFSREIVKDVLPGSFVRCWLEPGLGGKDRGFAVIEVAAVEVLSGGKSHQSMREELLSAGRHKKQKTSHPRWDRPVIVIGPDGHGVHDCREVFKTEGVLHHYVTLGLENAQAVATAIRTWGPEASYLIVAQGGVSVGAFNDSTVIDAVAESCAPVVLGLGHTAVRSVAGAIAHYEAAVPRDAGQWVSHRYQDRRKALEHIGSAVLQIRDSISTVSIHARNEHKLETLTREMRFRRDTTIRDLTAILHRMSSALTSMNGAFERRTHGTHLAQVYADVLAAQLVAHSERQERLSTVVDSLSGHIEQSWPRLGSLTDAITASGLHADYQISRSISKLIQATRNTDSRVSEAKTGLLNAREGVSTHLRATQEQVLIFDSYDDSQVPLADLVAGNSYLLRDHSGRACRVQVLDGPAPDKESLPEPKFVTRRVRM